MRHTQSFVTGAPSPEGTSAFYPLTDLLGFPTLGATVGRIRGLLVASHATLVGTGVLGFRIIQSSDWGSNLNDYPLQAEAREDDWMGFIPFCYSPAGGVEPGDPLGSVNPFEIDVKAMRRMDEMGMQLVGAIDCDGVDGVGISIVTSTLLLLP